MTTTSTLQTPRRTTSAPPSKSTQGAIQQVPGAPQEMPGPRLYKILRLWLVIAAIVSAAVGISCVIATHTAQENSASQVSYTQYLYDLRAQVTETDAQSLVSNLSHADSATLDRYNQSMLTVDSLVVSIAKEEASDQGSVASLLTAVRTWEASSQVVARGDNDQTSVTTANSSFTDVDAAINDLISQAETQGSGSTAYLTIIGLTFLGLALASVIVCLVLTARRSHRVLNLGLTAALLGLVVSICAVGLFASSSAHITESNSSAKLLTAARAQIWSALREDCLSLLDASSSDTHASQADSLLLKAADTFSSFAVTDASITDISAVQTTITAVDGSSRVDLIVTNLDTWVAADEAATAAVDQWRPDKDSLVVTWLPSVIILAGMGIVTMGASIAGFHTRIKEYL